MKVDIFSVGEQEEQGNQHSGEPVQTGVCEVMQEQPLGIIERAQIDMQIATAKQFPRSISEAMDKAKNLACYSPLIASQCTYSVPRGGKKITGPSIRIAEIMGTSWGNLRYGGRVLSIGERSLVCQGVCHDLETNVSVSVEVSRGILDRDKHRYSEDMIVTTSMAGISIAIRNAIFKIVPAAFVSDVLTSAQKVARGEDQGLEARLASALTFFEDKGVPAVRVFVSLGIKGAEDVTWEHIDTLLGYATAIRVEGIPITDIFPAAPAKKTKKPPATPKSPTPEKPAPQTDEGALNKAVTVSAAHLAPEPTKPEPRPEPTTEPTTTPKPATATEAKPVNYAEAAHVLGEHGASWDMIYAAAKLPNGHEMTDVMKTAVIGWAGRVVGGESLESVLGLEPLQETVGPPVGEAPFGRKAVEANEAAAAEDVKPKTTGATELDF